MSPTYIKILLLVLPVVIYTQLISSVYSGGGQVFTFANNIKSSRDLIPQYEAAFDQADSLVNQVKELRKDYDNFDKDLQAKLDKIIPPSVNEIMLQDEFVEYAKASNVTLEKITVGKSTISIYPELGVYGGTAEFTGSYEDFKKALRFIETNLRYLDILSVDFGFTKDSPTLTTMKLSYQTYYLK
jgi:hypothetical protein